MQEHGEQGLRSILAAVLVASFLILVHGVAHHALAARLAAPGAATPIALEVLAKLPLEIGAWTGRDVPLDEDIVRRTDTDAHLNRQYARGRGLEPVSLYVACGVKTRDLMPHRPEVCYVGAGWTRIARRSLELSLNDGTTVPCNVIYFARGAFNTSKIVVLDYYIVDGQYCRDVSLLRSKAWRGSSLVGYATQVQIMASVTETSNVQSTTQSISDFAVDSAPLIFHLFEPIAKSQNADPSREKETGISTDDRG